MEKIIVSFLSVIGIALIIGLLMGFPTMWCWNYLMPELFGLKEINFWQALVMQGLCSALFKSSSSSKSKD